MNQRVKRWVDSGSDEECSLDKSKEASVQQDGIAFPNQDEDGHYGYFRMSLDDFHVEEKMDLVSKKKNTPRSR